jgi:hypothetical protein
VEALSSAGLVVALIAFGVSVAGFLVLIVGIREEGRRLVGLRLVYLGIAVAGIGLAVFALTRPSESLTLPLRLFVALVLGIVSLRVTVAAVLLKPRGRGPGPGDIPAR